MTRIKMMLDRFEGEKAVLIFDDGQILVINRSILPLQIKEGDSLEASFFINEKETARKKARVKKILTQIVKNNGEDRGKN